MTRYQSILDTVGDTPLVKLNRLVPAGVNLYLKLESFNPMGSVKDRMACAVIERAEKSGELEPGQTVIEATSGNTGIGLAMVCARKGYPLVVTMAENFSIERRKLPRFLGARVVLTPAADKGTGMLDKAVELAEKHGYYLCRQFENEANTDNHSETTALEIIADFKGDNRHCWVSGFGTGGTLKGVARALKQHDPAIRIIAAEPDNARVLGSGIPQSRDANGKPSASRPRFGPHLMQGWSPDFISRLTEDVVTAGFIDEVVPVAGNDTLRLARQLASHEGILVGTSSGATLAAALDVAHRSPAGTNIVRMCPDTGERYLSTPLSEHITEAMTEEESALSRSTPGYRFDAPSACSLVQPCLPPGNKLDPVTEQLVSDIITAEPVVMFALEWCEFSWSVRKLLASLDIPYRSVDQDSVAYQDNDLGGKIRSALARRIGSVTIPQFFIGGNCIGGCTDILEACVDGTLKQRLVATGIALDGKREIDPARLMPEWVQPRQTA